MYSHKMDKQSGVYYDDVVKRLIEMLCKSSNVIAQQSIESLFLWFQYFNRSKGSLVNCDKPMVILLDVSKVQTQAVIRFFTPYCFIVGYKTLLLMYVRKWCVCLLIIISLGIITMVTKHVLSNSFSNIKCEIFLYIFFSFILDIQP